ncbi:hypothetical protein FHS72_003249 [Loktanella ponticola]|uniref:Uncharacterized protein n=1 Tax=Yoonia ponticola TaxID=1524255 RepID=A0A7W9BN59_9RHOB|nr:hypothetical protein [Yoonia ponticola]MBB5723604.1 hypothetical protein [Yoonia ponticola]
MFQHRFDTTTATPVKLIELQILEGLAACKPVSEIAQNIAATLAVPDEKPNPA